jgi:hypothetical protein
MQIQDIRRARLREWFATRSIPPKEKSYISQLLKEGNPFGERAARRLENTYGMGEMFLDTVDAPDNQEPTSSNMNSHLYHAQAPDTLLQAIRLLELFHRTDERGRSDMLRLAETLCRPSQNVRGNEG